MEIGNFFKNFPWPLFCINQNVPTFIVAQVIVKNNKTRIEALMMMMGSGTLSHNDYVPIFKAQRMYEMVILATGIGKFEFSAALFDI